MTEARLQEIRTMVDCRHISPSERFGAGSYLSAIHGTLNELLAAFETTQASLRQEQQVGEFLAGDCRRLVASLKEMERERDAARSEVEKWRREAVDALKAETQFREERDEARKIAIHLMEDCSYGHKVLLKRAHHWLGEGAGE